MAKRKFLFGDQGITDQLNAPEGMSLDFLHGGMPQQALKQAMAAQTNTDQIQPKINPENLDSAGAEAHAQFKPKFSQKLFGYDEPNSQPVDEYGLEKPKVHHEGALSKIAGIGLPALVGLAGGVGLLPGIATGFFRERGREAAGNKQESQAYNTSRAAAYQADKLQKELDLKTNAQNEAARHNKAMEVLKGSTLSGKKDEKRALEIETKYRQGLPTSNEERAFLKAYYRLKNTRAAENPLESIE